MKTEDIEVFLTSYAAAWASNDSDKIALHWDSNEPEPFYKAEEELNYFHDFVEIRNYWKHNEAFHQAIRLKFSNISFKSLPGAYAQVFIRMRWDIKFADNAKTPYGAVFNQAGKLMGGENHVLALIRDADSELKLVGWSETPDAPISYMRQLYEWVAQPITEQM